MAVKNGDLISGWDMLVDYPFCQCPGDGSKSCIISAAGNIQFGVFDTVEFHYHRQRLSSSLDTITESLPIV